MPLFGHHKKSSKTGSNVLHKNDPSQGGTEEMDTGQQGNTDSGYQQGDTAGGTDRDPKFNNNSSAVPGNTYDNSTGNASGHHGHTGPGPILGGVAGGTVGHHEGHTAAGTALGATAGQHHAHTHPDVSHTGATGRAGTDTGATAVPGGGTAGSAPHPVAGKVEHAAGTILGSSTLKEKGLEKEREAQALRLQAGELEQAEKLEAQATARRERAVGHGAHPDNLGRGGAGGVASEGGGITGRSGNVADVGGGTAGQGIVGSAGGGYDKEQPREAFDGAGAHSGRGYDRNNQGGRGLENTQGEGATGYDNIQTGGGGYGAPGGGRAAYDNTQSGGGGGYGGQSENYAGSPNVGATNRGSASGMGPSGAGLR